MKPASLKSLLPVAVFLFSIGIFVTPAQGQRTEIPVVVTNTTARPCTELPAPRDGDLVRSSKRGLDDELHG